MPAVKKIKLPSGIVLDIEDGRIASSNPTDGQILVYNATSGKFENTTNTESHDFTHTPNTTVSASTATVTFAANTRGSVTLTVSADLALTIVCNNLSDNYIWIKNSGSAEADIVIGGVQHNGSAVTNVYVPSDGITVPAGGLCEIGIIVNTDGAFITSRNDLTL